LSVARSNRTPEADSDASTVADHAGRASRYLTDGADLYRCLRTIASDPGRLVALENCRSLEAILLSINDLHARGLRAVDA